MSETGYIQAKAFADFLNTTKATLRHYRELGLLEPAKISPSGYALYGPHQVSDYVLIASLRGAGCSLSEIKEYLNLANSDELLDILAEKITDIDARQQELERRKRVLQTSIIRARALSEWTHLLNKQPPLWQTRECGEEHFIKTDAPMILGRETELLEAVDSHIQYCVSIGGGQGLQTSNLIKKECFTRREFGKGYALLTQLPEPIPCDRLLVKPAGLYFCWLRRVTAGELKGRTELNPLFNEYDLILDYHNKQGNSLKSDVFESGLSLYSGNMNEVQYSEIQMLIG